MRIEFYANHQLLFVRMREDGVPRRTDEVIHKGKAYKVVDLSWDESANERTLAQIPDVKVYLEEV